MDYSGLPTPTPSLQVLTCPFPGLDMVFLARWTLGCPSGLGVATGGSGPAVAAPWAPGILSSRIAKLWTDGGDFPAPVIDILARLGQAPPLLGEEGNDFVAWPGRKTGRQAGRSKVRGKVVRGHPTSPLQAPQPLTQQDAAPVEVPISLESLRFIPNEWCGSHRGVSPLIAHGDRDRGWG